MVVVVLIWVIGWLLIEKAFIVVLSIHLLEFKEVIGVEELLLSLLLLVAFDAWDLSTCYTLLLTFRVKD